MAIKHTLALDIPETACENIIRILDASVYGTGLDIDCPRLDIYLPGFSLPIYYSPDPDAIPPKTLEPGFIKNFSTADLGITGNDQPLSTFPDGLYTIKYSVSPNDTVYVQYYHLRTTNLVNTYYREICKVQLQACEPTAEQHQRMHDLRYIKMYVDAAKAKAEYCNAPVQAVEMYQYAEKLLAKYLTGCCVSCSSCNN
jgi:hypothetical protein